MATEGTKSALALKVASGLTVAASAAALGIPRRTAFRWAAAPEFRAEVDRLRRGLIDQALGKLTAVSTAAADALADLVTAENSPGIRLRAAKVIVQSLISIQQHAQLAERVSELERRLADGGPQSPGRSPVG